MSEIFGTSWLDIFDDAIKIGLGATIGMLGSFFHSKQSYKQEKDKDLRKHKLELIEFIATKVDHYFNAYLRFANTISGYSRTHNVIDEIDCPDAVRKIIDDRDDQLMDSVYERKEAEARLRLLGATEAVDSLLNSNKILNAMRDKLIFEKRLPSRQFIDQNIAEFYRVKSSFEHGLMQFYSKL